jgi:hypothetical protein
VSILDNRFHGQFVIGDDDVSRAMITSDGYSGITISGNTVYALRQPCYFSGSLVNSGTVSSKHVHGTKGWVIEGGNWTFTGNTWGTGASANVHDVTILATCQPAYYPDIVAMGVANNDAVVEDQRPATDVLNQAFVVAGAGGGGGGGRVDPYQAIAPAVSRVVAGGTIHVAAGTYAGGFGLDRAPFFFNNPLLTFDDNHLGQLADDECLFIAGNWNGTTGCVAHVTNNVWEDRPPPA